MIFGFPFLLAHLTYWDSVRISSGARKGRRRCDPTKDSWWNIHQDPHSSFWKNIPQFGFIIMKSDNVQWAKYRTEWKLFITNLKGPSTSRYIRYLNILYVGHIKSNYTLFLHSWQPWQWGTSRRIWNKFTSVPQKNSKAIGTVFCGAHLF